LCISETETKIKNLQAQIQTERTHLQSLDKRKREFESKLSELESDPNRSLYCKKDPKKRDSIEISFSNRDGREQLRNWIDATVKAIREAELSQRKLEQALSHAQVSLEQAKAVPATSFPGTIGESYDAMRGMESEIARLRKEIAELRAKIPRPSAEQGDSPNAGDPTSVPVQDPMANLAFQLFERSLVQNPPAPDVKLWTDAAVH